MATMLEKLKIQLEIKDNSKDDLLDLLLEDVETDILTWTNRSELPKALESTQRQLAIIRYNMMGVEGQTSHSEGGVSRSFEDLPAVVKKTISQFVKAKVTRYGSS
ncbi:phage head-tail connector protein [Neobacillus sp. NPDC058068]|uniref:phage head-tail connector protein n=1 Tax=Neobacillus sp. NPDC058068 TaxID=3346325 RepID=UPI0036DB5958